MPEQRYRLVSDYGFGDKAWLERDLTAEQAVEELNSQIGRRLETIDQALWAEHPIYSIEEDHENDEVDWDWMDS